MKSDSRGAAAGYERAPRRFLIVDAHEPLRTSLAHFIERRLSYQVVGRADGAVEGLRMASERRPDVAIVDLRLKEVDGIELTQSLKRLLPDVRVIAYTFEDEPACVARFVQAGGHGFVSKDEPIEALIEAIELALEGRLRIAFRAPDANQGQQGETEPSA